MSGGFFVDVIRDGVTVRGTIGVATESEARAEVERTLMQSGAPSLFDGVTYEPELDEARLTTQLQRVKAALLTGRWYTLAELAAVSGGSEAGVSARLRDLRKAKWGGYVIQRERVAGGLFRYRLIEGCE